MDGSNHMRTEHLSSRVKANHSFRVPSSRNIQKITILSALLQKGGKRESRHTLLLILCERKSLEVEGKGVKHYAVSLLFAKGFVKKCNALETLSHVKQMGM